MKNSILFVCFFLLTSCSSIYQFTIEVLEPAPVIFPAGIDNILVLNNSLPQPGDVGVERTFKGIAIKGMEVSLDSTAWVVTASLAEHLQRSRFFDKIAFYRQPGRTSGNWMHSKPVPKTFIQDLFDIKGFDGIVSVDRVLFNLKEDVQENYFTDIRLEAAVTCSIYLYDREMPSNTFTVSDTLFYKTIIVADTLAVFKELPEYLMDELAYNIGEKLTAYITPSWAQRNRILYSGHQARMQEALSFARAGKWERAEAIWMSEYAVASKPLFKGRMANNIAVAYEMRDQLDTALQWAVTAQELLKADIRTNKLENGAEIDRYIRDLQQRIRNNRLLDLQSRE